MSEMLMPVIKRFMKADEWPITEKDSTHLTTNFKGKNATYRIVVVTNEKSQRASFIACGAEDVPVNRRDAVAEFLARANYGMKLGFFTIDYSDGQVCFTTAIDTEGSFLSETQVKNYLYSSVLCMDKYFPGIKAVMSGRKTAKDAVREIESK